MCNKDVQAQNIRMASLLTAKTKAEFFSIHDITPKSLCPLSILSKVPKNKSYQSIRSIKLLKLDLFQIDVVGHFRCSHLIQP